MTLTNNNIANFMQESIDEAIRFAKEEGNLEGSIEYNRDISRYLDPFMPEILVLAEDFNEKGYNRYLEGNEEIGLGELRLIEETIVKLREKGEERYEW